MLVFKIFLEYDEMEHWIIAGNESKLTLKFENRSFSSLQYTPFSNKNTIKF